MLTAVFQKNQVEISRRSKHSKNCKQKIKEVILEIQKCNNLKLTSLRDNVIFDSLFVLHIIWFVCFTLAAVFILKFMQYFILFDRQFQISFHI